jgi:energy-coupling factor transporter ATP-binding protein EcfA2
VAPPGQEFRVFDLRDFRPRAVARAAAPDDARPHVRRDPEFHGSAALTGYELAAFEAMAVQPQPHAFEFRSAAYRFPDSDASSRYVLAFELPGTALAATPAGSGKRKLRAVLLALVRDAGGQVVQKVSEDFSPEVTETQLAALRAATLSYAHPIALAAGHYTVATVALDRETGRASTGAFEIDNPERKGLALSSLVLTQRFEPARSTGDTDDADPLRFHGQRIVPAIDASLPANAQPFVYFVAYPSRLNNATPKVGVEFLLGGKVVASQTADVPPPDATGAAAMTIEGIPKPGNYQIEITMIQGGESVEQSIRYSIAAR